MRRLSEFEEKDGDLFMINDSPDMVSLSYIKNKLRKGENVEKCVRIVQDEKFVNEMKNVPESIYEGYRNYSETGEMSKESDTLNGIHGEVVEIDIAEQELEKPFQVYCKGKEIGGDVMFWKSGKSYYYQAVGIGNPKKTTKEMYNEALKLHKLQSNAV